MKDPCSFVTVVRFNGGPQAGHHVVEPSGRGHTFSHFGSGTLVPGVRTHLSRFMLVSPWCMIVEERKLVSIGILDAMERTTISEDCVVITPFHRAANRLRERARGGARHGSCGIGFGETVKDSLELGEDLVVRMRDFRDSEVLARKLEHVRLHKLQELECDGVINAVRHMREALEDLDELALPVSVMATIQCLGDFSARVNIVPDTYLIEVLALTQEVWQLVDLGFGDQGKGTTVDFLARTRKNAVIFEPAQGVLLDEWCGFHPHTTWSTCTFDNADRLLTEAGYTGQVYRLGILRVYATRHGAGPFVTEDPELTARLPEHSGTDTVWTGVFRVGHFDAVSARYAIECCGDIEMFDGLVVTCLDRLADENVRKVCTAYEFSDGCTIRRIELGPFKSLDYQAALTEELFQARPVYEILTSNFDAQVVLDCIQRELGLPIHLTSWGPTYTDKQWEPAGKFHLEKNGFTS